MSRFDPAIVAAVRRMKGEGRRTADIAMSVGLTESQIRGLCHVRSIRRPTSGRLDVALGAQMIEAYRAEAERRGERFNAFMRTLLLTILHPDKDKPDAAPLFSAILDDGK